MPVDSNNDHDTDDQFTINIAIVGGGRACRFFLELLQDTSFPLLNINVMAVCDINSQAQGLVLARQMGISTTSRYQDFFKLPGLDGIIELTNNPDVLLDLIKSRPKRVGILEHNIGRFFRYYFLLNQRLQSAEHQAALEKTVSDFIMRHTNAAIVIISTDFTITDANEAYLKTVKKPREEVIGRYCYEIYHNFNTPCSSAQPILRCPMLETLKTSQTAHVIHEQRGLSGYTTYSDVVTYPLKNEMGEVTGVIEILHDITEDISARWEKQAQDLKADLRRMIQEDRMISLGKLVASCVHEINNPIQGLLTYSDLMCRITSGEDPTPENWQQLNDYLNVMSSELMRCGDIVSGLLSFSRETPPGWVELNLNAIIEAVISLTRHKMELQNIRLTLKLTPGPIMVRGDHNRLQQAMLNLVFNAIESMPEGGALTIATHTAAKAKRAVVSVQDTGYGISEQNLDHIYDPFFTTKALGEGTGLGLSIVYGVIKNHGGDIKVRSTVASGTVFTLQLPLV